MDQEIEQNELTMEQNRHEQNLEVSVDGQGKTNEETSERIVRVYRGYRILTQWGCLTYAEAHQTPGWPHRRFLTARSQRYFQLPELPKYG